jgi:hypothetical protein
MGNWKDFWIETNQLFGWVKSREDWESDIAFYASVHHYTLEEAKEALLNARRCKMHEHCFGYYMEHTEEKRLRDWFEENGMEI